MVIVRNACIRDETLPVPTVSNWSEIRRFTDTRKSANGGEVLS